MDGPLNGIRVVELAGWVAGPGVGLLLADWGADVIKIESPEGDAWRYSVWATASNEGMEAPGFEVANRGKRGVVLNLKEADQRAQAYALIGGADIFLTNLRQAALDHLGMDAATIRQRAPAIVYVQVTGFGLSGPDQGRPGFDYSAYWSKAGFGMIVGEPGQPPVLPRPANGDFPTATMATAATLAALYRRTTTGYGDHVHVSLAGMGAFVLSVDHANLLQGGMAAERRTRDEPTSPLFNSYEMGDGKWIMLACFQSDRHWPDVCLALDRPDLLTDERFLTPDRRTEHTRELTAILTAEFRKRPLREWRPIFDRYNLIWEAFHDIASAQSDPQYEALGTFPEYVDPRIGRPVRTVDSPAHFGAFPRKFTVGAPHLGQHTEEVLRELNGRA